MSSPYEADDRELISRLQGEISKREELERRIKALEHERRQLQDSAHQLSQELGHYRKERQEWEWFFENSLEMLCIAGLDGYFKRVNPAFSRVLGYSTDELLARPFTDFIHPDDIENTRQELAALGEGQDSINFENRYRDAKGQWRWIAWHCPALTQATTNLYAIARDITDRKRSEAEILHRALHDPLTDLCNRAAFEEKLADAIGLCGREPACQLALYLVDIDGFKAVNDSQGHQAGDRLLVTLAHRYRQLQREGDLVFRLGGDEFAFLIEAPGTLAVEPLAKRILEASSQPLELPLGTVQVGCSIGIAVFPTQASDADSLVAMADTAMYQVKKTGKKGFRLFERG
ncbi:sensor domain-containing diguanylate cyclase [Gallaecimonas kandeliae]|uniref:sensor domain-containing diguanylate cyclase n=1 Tax=Gallaecimonas kandeliae TaxID=3029055 RepID=UPI0026472152|nr:sensor domain-containing diguanylate cyclase [Gallaecimonas kandeliae]WKE64265.1 sensor domain-containing diguanylate cyclase [Gallaecimonas kandeliae]